MDFFRETDVIFANTNVLCKKATFPVDKLENMFRYMTFHSMKMARLGSDKDLRSRQGTFYMYKEVGRPWIILCLSAYNAGPEFKFNKISKHRADRTFNDEHERELRSDSQEQREYNFMMSCNAARVFIPPESERFVLFSHKTS